LLIVLLMVLFCKPADYTPPVCSDVLYYGNSMEQVLRSCSPEKIERRTEWSKDAFQKVDEIHEVVVNDGRRHYLVFMNKRLYTMAPQ